MSISKILIAAVSGWLLLAGCIRRPARENLGSLPPYNLPDGTYEGVSRDSVMGKPVEAKVVLTLKKGRIIDIRVLAGKSLTAGVDTIIPARILRYQTPYVDVVTGATTSSEMIMKAASKALIEARKKRVGRK